MTGRGLCQHGEPVVGEHRVGTPTVGRTAVSADPPLVFEAVDRVGEPTPRRLSRRCEIAHSQRAVRRVREHHQDLVVAERPVSVRWRSALDLLPEQAGPNTKASQVARSSSSSHRVGDMGAVDAFVVLVPCGHGNRIIRFLVDFSTIYLTSQLPVVECSITE